MQNPDYTSYSIESIANLIDGKIRPEWVLIPQRSHDCGRRFYCSEATILAIKNLGKNLPSDPPMYILEKVLSSEISDNNPHSKSNRGLYFGRRYLFRLNLDDFTPF